MLTDRTTTDSVSGRFQRVGHSHGERGVFIVIGALWVSVFLMLTALAIDTFFLATTKLQQGNTVDYLALSALHALKDPPSGATPPSGNGYDTTTYNFVIDKAAVVAAASILGSSAAQASASDLHIRFSSGGDDDGEGCGTDDEGFGGSGPSGGGSSECGGIDNIKNCGSREVKDKWCGFEGMSEVGSVIFGQYDPGTGGFTPAPVGGVGTVNAVRVRLQLKDPSASPLVLPMMKLVLTSGHLMFESKATAYRDGTGRYMLVNSGS